MSSTLLIFLITILLASVKADSEVTESSGKFIEKGKGYSMKSRSSK